MNNKQNFGNLTFGFDIGIASVGWAVLNEKRIVDLGVRCFDEAETAKEGESLNLARRTARLLRRRLRRRAWRLTRLARLLKSEGLINDVNLLKHPPSKGFATPNLWQLRVEGLDRKLNPEEWARVIYHLCKHRGFHWVSKAEKLKDEDSASETGKVKKGLAATTKLMKEKGYRTAAEMVLAEFPDAQRNKHGEYSKALERELLSKEFVALFEAQRSFGNSYTSATLEEKLLNRETGLFWSQKSSLSDEALLKMLGKCTFEKSEFRAPKASFTAERHVWLTRLNNLRLVVDGVMRPLTTDECRLVINLPYNQAGYVKYKELKSLLVKQAGLSEITRFTGLSYPSASELEAGKAKNPEDSILVKMPAFQALRKTLKEGLETEWQGMINAALAGDASLLDQIARVLSIYKEDDKVARELNELNLPNKEKMVSALLGLRFDKFSNLSLKALYKIVPVMEQGKRYDEACVEAGYHHSQLIDNDDIKEIYLPPLYEHIRGKEKHNLNKMLPSEKLDSKIQGGIPRNPVVLRALNQARKVCNALIKKYGSPYQVNIELARDLSKPFDERRKIQTEQEAFRDRNQALRNTFNQTSNATGELKGRDFEKWQLYEEQQGKCAYSLQPLDIHRLFDLGYVEIDHALPYSRSFDDSKNNRVLVLINQNRNKGDQTPYEYLEGKNNSERWRLFVAFVEQNKSYRQAKRNRLLKKDFGDNEAKEMRERNLQDTRYICKFFKNYVEHFLKFSEASDAKRCVVVSGSLTSLLRAKWGLPNSKEKREKSDRHHAMDAVVVAASGHYVVKQLSTFVNQNNWAHRPEQGGYVNTETGEFLFTKDFVKLDEVAKLFPRPWKSFRDDLLNRLETDDIVQLRQNAEKMGIYSSDEIQNLKPIFISRAPQRRNSGALHKETIYGTIQSRGQIQPQRIKRKEIGSLKEADLQDIVGASEPRNEGLIKSLRMWLKSQGELKALMVELGKGKSKREPTIIEKDKIDRLSHPPRKPLKSDPANGPFTGPEVKKVKVIETSKSAVLVRGGLAELGKVISTRIYRYQGELIFQPRYEASYEKLFGVANVPPEANYTGIELYGNEIVKIEHPNLAYCFKFVRRYFEKETGEILVDVEKVFPNDEFLGYWLYFEPSNNRPVVSLHDGSEFFLLEANKTPTQSSFTLIELKKVDGNKISYEYLEKSPPIERKPFKFSLEREIKRQIGSAKTFQKLNVDVLGSLFNNI